MECVDGLRRQELVYGGGSLLLFIADWVGGTDSWRCLLLSEEKVWESVKDGSTSEEGWG